MKKKILLLLLSFSLLATSCFTDKDDEIQIASTLDIQNFIYRGLNFFYLYKSDIPQLADDAFANQSDLNNFLNEFETPEDIFANLKSTQDRFSILVDDYVELENALNGVTLNNGMDFGLVRFPAGSSSVIGYVRLVLPNTDAASKGVTRGMIFDRIDDQLITDENFSTLLEPGSYSIGLATFDGTTVTSTSETITLNKTEYTENPVFITNTLDVQGQKIGYLMYNAFTRNFASELNGAFAQFQGDGVTDLILDLRYNGGGSVENAVDLASMITGQFNGQKMYSEQWNDDRQGDYASDGDFDNNITGGANTNSLNLTRVFIITTGRSASASELVINGLDPYITVTQVGGTTTGKFQASFLLYDAPAPNFSRNQANPGHRYAMLPLVFKTANAAGFTDFVDGLVPEVPIDEDLTNLGALGDVNEPLLAAALNQIVPNPNPQPHFTRGLEFEEISESKENSPLYQLMIANE